MNINLITNNTVPM